MFVKHGPCSIVAANRELIHLLLGVALGLGAPQRGPTPNLERRPTNIRSPRDVRSRGRESPRLASNRPCAESMGARPTVDFPHASEERARIPQEMSNFYCHPGKAGGSPMILDPRPSGGRERRKQSTSVPMSTKYQQFRIALIYTLHLSFSGLLAGPALIPSHGRGAA